MRHHYEPRRWHAASARVRKAAIYGPAGQIGKFINYLHLIFAFYFNFLAGPANREFTRFLLSFFYSYLRGRGCTYHLIVDKHTCSGCLE
jgi:hypothetical protein